MKTLSIEQLSQMAKKVTDLYSKMNTAWPKTDEQNLNVAIMAGLQDAYIKGQSDLMVENARLIEENERLTHSVSFGSGGK